MRLFKRLQMHLLVIIVNSKELNRLLGEPICNFCQSYLDDFVEANVNLRLDSGVNSVIIRQMLANCCNWCKGIAGVYNAYSAPDNIYQRHDHCKCVVTFKKSNKKYQNAHSKKKFDTYRDARIEGINQLDEIPIPKENRISKAVEQDQKLKLKGAIDKLLRLAFDDGKYYADVTEAYIKNKLSGNIVVDKLFGKSNKIVLSKERQFKVDPMGEERSMARVLSDFFGGNIEVRPRIVKPEGIRTSDYRINGKLAELKTPSTNILSRVVKEGKGQASHIILNLDDDKCTCSLDNAIKQVSLLFSNDEYNWLDTCTLIKDGKVKKVIMRTQKKK